jgi:chromosomal replication initiation ATPase DnaA
MHHRVSAFGSESASDRLAPRSRLRLERLRQDPLAYALVVRIARRRRVSLRDLMQGSRGAGSACHARQIAMYLCHVVLGRTQDVVGELFGRDRTTVSHACVQIEMQRERDLALDAELMLAESEEWLQPAPGELSEAPDAR